MATPFGKIWSTAGGTLPPAELLSTLAISTVYPSFGDLVRRNGSGFQFIADGEGLAASPVYGICIHGVVDKLKVPGYNGPVMGGAGVIGQPGVAHFGGVGSRASGPSPQNQREISRVFIDQRYVATAYVPTGGASTVLTALTAGATSLVLASGGGALMPQTAGRVQVDQEIISYTGITSDTLTGLTRGLDGTTATTHATGNAVVAVPAIGSKYSLKRVAAGDYRVNLDPTLAASSAAVICNGYYSSDVTQALDPYRAWYKFLNVDQG